MPNLQSYPLNRKNDENIVDFLSENWSF